MIFLTPVVRLSLVIALLTINILFAANLLGFLPDEDRLIVEQRKDIVEALALQCCAAVEQGEMKVIRDTLRAVVERNRAILSAAVRAGDGQIVALAGDHLAHFKPRPDGKSTPTSLHVPIFRDGKKWGTMEISFAPLWKERLKRGFRDSFAGLALFMGVGGFLCYFLVIKRTLRELDPSRVIPGRVQTAFDILQEGVVLFDVDEQIVMTNSSFAELFGKTPESMIGLKGSELGWVECQSPDEVGQLPWLRLLNEGEEQAEASLSLLDRNGSKFMVHAVGVSDPGGKKRGCLVTFDNITEVEEKNFQLNELVEKLRQANQEIMGKTRELEVLASCDPMTLCLNRRAFGQKLDGFFTSGKANGEKLSCLMLDIDFFKSVNDNYGHAAGDQVIKAVADVLKVSTRDTDLVARYGGEEFCVLLPGLDLKEAAMVGERIRKTIESKTIAGINVTISVGASTLNDSVNKPDELVNQADKALYAAKEGGRNRVTTWGEDLEVITDTDKAAKAERQGSEKQGESESDTDVASLQGRIQELEGLLAKRTLELQHFEMYDFKTGLPNRSLFEDRLRREIARSRRSNRLFAVLFINMETIKRLQETHGMKVAEELMHACGQRLNDTLRRDIDTVAAMDGTREESTISLLNPAEFGIILTDIKQVDHVTWVVKRLLGSFETPFEISDSEIYVSLYLGISIFPHDGTDVDHLYSSAINACTHARKFKGSERYLFASKSLNDKVASQLELENLLHDVIDNNELQLYYQPIVKAQTGHVAKFEALLRWNSPVLGMVSPDKFIPVMEQSGQIGAVGDWVMYNACRQLRGWLDKGLEVGSVAVNISVLQLDQTNLAQRIGEILEEFAIKPQMLEVELTENSFLDINDRTFSVMKQIWDMGVRLSMDDFGTGYSSLSYLNKIPLSTLKIDRSFVADINKDESADKLITSIISLAHGLGLEVVAEGVEETEQREFLTGLGCEFLQGYYFSRPVPESEVPDILSSGLVINA